jgi:hypothetical protein
VNDIFKGAKSILTDPKGWGMLLAIFAVFVAAQAFGFGDDDVAMDIRERLGR